MIIQVLIYIKTTARITTLHHLPAAYAACAQLQQSRVWLRVSGVSALNPPPPAPPADTSPEWNKQQKQKDLIPASSLQVISNVCSPLSSYLFHLSQSLGNHTDSQPRMEARGEKGFLAKSAPTFLVHLSWLNLGTAGNRNTTSGFVLKWGRMLCRWISGVASEEQGRNEAVSNGNYTAAQG